MTRQTFTKAAREEAPIVEPALAYAQKRCKTVNPNLKSIPCPRLRSPRCVRNRRPAGWTILRVTIPRITAEGLARAAVILAEEGRRSTWPRGRRRYPRSKSHLAGEAIDDFLRRLGFEEFCISPSPHAEDPY